jgi:DNA transformation protein
MAKRDRSISELKNLGPVTARLLNEAGIESERQLHSIGPVAAYCRLKHMAPLRITLVCLYALEGALSDTHWNKIPGSRKEALRGRVSAALRGGVKG